MIKFEKVTKFAEIDFPMPERKTKYSAGYDMAVAEDTVIPPAIEQLISLEKYVDREKTYSLEDIAKFTKLSKAKPTLVSTGVKCYLEEDTYLELSVRSSAPLKHWIVMANSVGIIDSDYCDNPSNEGEIYFQLINLSPVPIILKKGDIIGQGIIKKYLTTEDDKAEGERLGGFGSTTK